MHTLLQTLLVAACALKTMAAPAAPAEPAESNVGTKQSVGESLNQFSSSLFLAVAKENSANLITSPFGTGIALSMAAYGARGETLDQFKKVLRIPYKINVYDYRGIIDDANSLTENELQLQNKLFTSEHFTVKPDYMEAIKDYFRSTAQTVDFAKPQIAANIINSWVGENTNNLIGNIVAPDELDGKTDLVLGNTVYFNGQWKKKFNPEYTLYRPFNVNSDTVKNVSTMYNRGTYQYGELPDFDCKFFAIPFEGEELSMVIILPNEIDGLAQVEKKIESQNVFNILNLAYSKELRIYVPKFKVESELSLESVLQKLGLTDAFTDRANFSGIASVDLRINKVLQKALIEVNEEGTTAAGTAEIGRLIPEARSLQEYPHIELLVDRPFIYSIIKTGDVNLELLRGHIIDPLSN